MIMDHFQRSEKQINLESPKDNNILVSLLPSLNTTDALEPMDIFANEPAKNYLKQYFEDWYTSEVRKQLEEIKTWKPSLKPVYLSFPVLKELRVKWLVRMSEYVHDNPHITANGFNRSGFTAAFDGNLSLKHCLARTVEVTPVLTPLTLQYNVSRARVT